MVHQDLIKALWEQQLAKEYRYIIWLYKIKGLYLPFIEVVDVTSFWGQWEVIERRIKISKKLIQNYSWDIVIQILKHEIAHQMVSDLFQNHVDGHGKLFKQCCQWIGLSDEFSKSVLYMDGPIKTWRDSSSESSEDIALLKKVEKLLSLSQSSNENEALLAMEKVLELFKKYNIERLQDQKKSKYVYAIVNKKSQKLSAAQCYISHILKEFYFVDVVYSSLYEAADQKVYKTIEIFGTLENVQMAEYVYYFLENKVEDLWLDYGKANTVSGRLKRSYVLGLLEGFRSKLRNIDKTSVNSKFSALVIVENDQKLTNFISEKYPSLRSKKKTQAGVFGSVFEHGLADGNKIILNKGISKQESTKASKFLLE